VPSTAQYRFFACKETYVSTKTEKLEIRVLPADKQALRGIARVEGEAMAVVLRKLNWDRARELGVLRPEPYNRRANESAAA
jgi:hypothetical protein